MIFTTYWFLTFLAIVVACYWLLPRPSLRLVFLGGSRALCSTRTSRAPAGMAPIIVMMIVTYFAGRTRDARVCEGAMALCVAALTLLLQVPLLPYQFGLMVERLEPAARRGP